MLKVAVTLTFDLPIPKSIRIMHGSWPTKTPIIVFLSLIGIIYGSWSSMIPRNVNLGEITLIS